MWRQGKSQQAEALLAERLPGHDVHYRKTSEAWPFNVWDARLDSARGILWMTGDILITLARSVAYPFDLSGRPLSPNEVVNVPSANWWRYDEDFPSGLVMAIPRCTRSLGYSQLLAAPGDGTLVYEDSEGHRYVMDYNGHILDTTE